MTALSFYRRAAALPLVLPILAGILLFTAEPRTTISPLVHTYQEVVGFVALAGACSAIPYLVYLFVVFVWWRPKTERQIRRSVWLAPFAVALLFGMAAGTAAFIRHGFGFGRMLGFLAFSGGLAIVTGLAYMILIELSFWLAKSRGWVE